MEMTIAQLHRSENGHDINSTPTNRLTKINITEHDISDNFDSSMDLTINTMPSMSTMPARLLRYNIDEYNNDSSSDSSSYISMDTDNIDSVQLSDSFESFDPPQPFNPSQPFDPHSPFNHRKLFLSNLVSLNYDYSSCYFMIFILSFDNGFHPHRHNRHELRSRHKYGAKR